MKLVNRIWIGKTWIRSSQQRM